MRKIPTLLILVTLFGACEQGLEPVTGFQGHVLLPTDSSGAVHWPDSLAGAVVTFADATVINQPGFKIEEIAEHLLGFSAPLDSTREVQDFFLEALPDRVYIAGVIGTTVPVQQLVVLPRDSLTAHPEYFRIFGVYQAPSSQTFFSFFSVKNDKITSGINIQVDYKFEVSN